MRKIAPFVLTTIAAVVAGTAFAANDMAPTTSSTVSPTVTTTTPQTASPTVPANTANPQGMSYSDKSNTSPGTNAKMDDKTTMGANGMVATDPAVEKRNEKARKKAKVVAKNTDPMMDKQTKDKSLMDKPMPNDGTNPAAANSLTGKSTGQ